MIETWRWFGPADPVTLRHIRQAGASAIVTSLHDMPTGATWSRDAIAERKALLAAHGFAWAVVESVPVHNEIKLGGSNAAALLDNYCETIRNLGAEGVSTVCYNFMAVVDWTRTNLRFETASTALSLRFDIAEFAAYDIFILERPEAAADYTLEVVQTAAQRAESMSDGERQALEQNIIAGLPGGYGSYGRSEILEVINQYQALGNAGLQQNLFAFLERVLPVAEEAGVMLCIHPDDPPFSLFGLPRVMSTAADARALLDRFPAINNGLTLCAGSFGARGDNDLIGMVREFGPRIHFTHLRNVTREPNGSFYESNHLDGDNDMVGLISALLEEERRRRADNRHDAIPMRPDHGHLLGDEEGAANVNPGYSFGGRMKSLAELRGVIHAVEALGKR